MVLPSLARLSIERAAPTAAPSDAPSDAPAPLATPSVGDVLERLAWQEQVAGDAAQKAALEVQSFLTSGAHEIPMHVAGEKVDREEAARAALDAFMDIGAHFVARALVTGPDDPREVDDAVVSLEWMLQMWDRYAIGRDRALLQDSFHASAQEKGLYRVLVDLLGRGLESHDRLYDRCMLLIVTMTGNLSGTFASVGSARAVDSNIHRLARTALAEASNGRLGSHLLASLANDMSTNIAEEYALTVLLDLTYTPYMTPNHPPDDSAPEPMTSTSAALAADENIVILFQMFEGTNADTHPSNIQNAALRVLSNVLYYNNGQTEPSPLLEQILKHDTVKTITGMFAQPNTTAWLQRDMALAFLERVLFALKKASEEVLDRAFEKFESRETAFVPTMLAYLKWVSLTNQGQHIVRIFCLFGQLDGRYKESQKWQRALVTDQGVYDYLETTLKEFDASQELNLQRVTVCIDLLKYTLLPTPELWERAQTQGLLDWMIDAATMKPHHIGGYVMKNQHTLHFVLSQIAAKNGGIAKWMLSSNPEGMRDNSLLYSWAPKKSPLLGYASGFRALLCHGTAYDHMTLFIAQRAAGMPMPPLLEEWEQWDWDAIAETLKDPEIAASAAVQEPGPSVHAALLIVLHIVQVLEGDPSSPDDPVAGIGKETMGARDARARERTLRGAARELESQYGKENLDERAGWDALLQQLMRQHEGNDQFASSLAYLVERATKLLYAPKLSNALFKRLLQKYDDGVVPNERRAKRPRPTTDAVYARFLDLAQLRFPN